MQTVDETIISGPHWSVSDWYRLPIMVDCVIFTVGRTDKSRTSMLSSVCAILSAMLLPHGGGNSVK